MKIIYSCILFLTIYSDAYSQLKIGVPNITEKLSHLEINSVGEYVIFDDLLRSLIKFDSNGELAPDLAASWETKEQFKKYILTIQSKEYFSDNSLITVQDVANSLRHTMSNPEIIHGDGKKIKKVSILNNNQIAIELSESNPFFLTELSSPEYRIVKNLGANYKITSGPYYISNNNYSKKISLKLNKNFPFNIKVKFKEVDYIPYKKLSDNKIKNIDLIWPTSTITPLEIKHILNQGYYIYKLNLGFSYWLSLNPASLNLNERAQIKHNLDVILKSSSFFFNNNFSKSRQLFLPYGPGRLTENEINNIDIKIDKELNYKKIKKIKILLPQQIQSDLLLELKSALPLLDINYYSDFSEYSNLVKSSKFDIALVNNDLSSIDLRSSINVTFNESRPLVWVNKNDMSYRTLLTNIQTEQNSLIRYASIKKLGEKMLTDVTIYPLYYDYGFIFVKNGIDLSSLNKSGAETYSWKIK